MVLISLVLVGCFLVRLSASQSCATQDYTVEYNGSTYFSVSAVNGSCFCRTFVADAFRGGAAGLTGLESHPTIVAINNQLAKVKAAAGISFNGSAVNVTQVTTVQAALEALYSGPAGAPSSNLAMHVLSDFPASPGRGQMFMDANSSNVFVWSGSLWRQMSFIHRRTFLDDFDGASLGSQWVKVLGTTTESVSGGVWTITDTSIGAETFGWVYDADCAHGTQVQWPMLIGERDFDVTFWLKWYSSDVTDLFGIYGAVVDANHYIIAGTGWADGDGASTTGIGRSFARNGVCPGGINGDDLMVTRATGPMNTFQAFRIRRQDRVMTTSINGVDTLSNLPAPYFVSAVAIVFVHYSGTGFGTAFVDSVSGWYEY
eukprot:TRINITY_DN3084_c0_g1_i1.p1 TRINITY_DN3084_c0_g1~~TRINITY_DN3084_c0_g1_i1.p1  ORF type:complete len:372 (+),score=84.00 TRINITY_DN3084_c0_g1_i1:138-1253(+)